MDSTIELHLLLQYLLTEKYNGLKLKKFFTFRISEKFAKICVLCIHRIRKHNTGISLAIKPSSFHFNLEKRTPFFSYKYVVDIKKEYIC
jgi:hypothetical protein